MYQLLNPFEPPVKPNSPRTIAYQLEYQRKKGQTIKGRAQRLYYSARTRARKYGLRFDLTLAWVEAQLKRGTCEATGLVFDLKPPDKTAKNKFAPSLDRKNPHWGYTLANTRAVIWLYNSCKGEYSDSDVIAFCVNVIRQDVVNHSKRDKTNAL
jgi:hypothetical protein